MDENKIIYKKKWFDPCPNKLFIAWMEEITKNAKKNQDKAYFTYKRGLASIKKCPLPLKSGKDCIILDGFGEKTCALLDKKLHELAKNQGVSIRRALKNGNKDFSKPVSKIPVFSKGSDGFAILVGLNELQMNMNSETCFVKKEIIQASVKYFRSSSNSSDSEQIWKVMSKLLKSSLVIKAGKKYGLSESGKELYCQIVQSEGKHKNISSTTSDSIDSEATDSLKPINQILDNESNNSPCENEMQSNHSKEQELISSTLSGQLIEPQFNGLHFYYCKSLNVNEQDFVNHKSDAATKMIFDEKYFRVKAKYDDLIEFDLEYQLDLSDLTQVDGYIFAFLPDKQSPERGSFVQETKETVKILKGKPIININKKSDCDNKAKLNNKRPSDCDQKNSPPIKVHANNYQSQTMKSILSRKPISKPDNDEELTEENTISYTMPKGSFEIVLIVDNRENFGTGKLKEHLCPDLIKKGVKLETRPLPIGDFLWIAKDNDGREAVLDIIIERKRYDDLVKSVQDQRFKDQKLRMKRSGISKIIYLLEKFKGMNNLSMTVEAIHQTLINSKVISNCEIYITDNESDTISYLHSLTEQVIEFYSSKILNVYNDCIPKERKHNVVFSKLTHQFPAIDFSSFKESGKKTKPIKVSEMFAKHLNCINGITAERAKAVINKYPVPRMLIESYERCASEKEKQLMLNVLKLTSDKTFGPANSKKVYAVYSRI